MEQSPDPISQPDAYRASLLATLGDEDVAVALESGPAALRQLIVESGALLRVRPEPTEWSVLECVGHMVDAELVMSTRMRWIVSEDRPEIMGYDQDLWVEAIHHNDDDPELLLALFEGLRHSNLDLWTRIPVEVHSRVGLHRERGPESYEMNVRLSAGHVRVHMAQARRGLARLKAAQSAPGDQA
ncbi:MAG: DinB family protein [Chloroflexi bacterium]|nr:DinB family protein [Chloroflexota bacterium]